MCFEVAEGLGQFGGSGKGSGESVLRDLAEREGVALLVEGVHDLVEAHEVSDERQILAMACLIGKCKRAGYNISEFSNVAHVKAAHRWINWKSPAHGSVRPPLRSQRADKVLVVEGRDDESVVHKPGFLHDLIDPGLASEVRHLELAAADRFHIRQR